MAGAVAAPAICGALGRALLCPIATGAPHRAAKVRIALERRARQGRRLDIGIAVEGGFTEAADGLKTSSGERALLMVRPPDTGRPGVVAAHMYGTPARASIEGATAREGSRAARGPVPQGVVPIGQVAGDAQAPRLRPPRFLYRVSGS
jgi:hypothetical protein